MQFLYICGGWSWRRVSLLWLLQFAAGSESAHLGFQVLRDFIQELKRVGVVLALHTAGDN